VSAAHEPHSAEHGGHDDHHGSPFIQHHYDDAQHQFDSGKLGIWLFLAQEVLFFSALFVAYILFRVHHGEMYSYAHKWLQVKFGAINTAVLIFSSLTAAWAVRAAQRGEKNLLIACIAVTIGCALTFLGIKYIEYNHKVHEHILFGKYFDPCVSPGGSELLTKHNDCAGTKSTIEWSKANGAIDLDTGNATKGCFSVADLDLDPHTPGVQADCEVSEVQGEGGTGAGRAITARCPEEKVGESAGEGEGGHEGHAEAPHFPCWRPAYQPAVCPDLTKPDAKLAGVGSQPQVGILVEYGDDQEREGISIKATCKKPGKPAEGVDAGASTGGGGLGHKAIAPVHELTTHEEHELESLGPPPPNTNMFFSIYFAMTGLHGVHVLVGVFVFIWLLIRAVKGQFTPDYFGPVDYAALYWHIVDLIWIFLFPLLYLIH